MAAMMCPERIRIGFVLVLVAVGSVNPGLLRYVQMAAVLLAVLQIAGEPRLGAHWWWSGGAKVRENGVAERAVLEQKESGVPRWGQMSHLHLCLLSVHLHPGHQPARAPW